MDATPESSPHARPMEDAHKDRRGRRITMTCRMFFFGEDDFEGEAKLLDLSASGCSTTNGR